ncbi:MAG TPA: GAF domain-containing sensor histidine kinase [Jatrophihabitans sp.]|jgi:signal transduction histidine kinase|uniref:sensor histidine kinase n=1 Tax=Jatrophihabitans sp. TaxID=1932789 RepID=UPI002EDC9A84
MTAASPVTAADRERDRIAALREYGILARLPVQRLSVGDEVTLAGFTELAAQVCGVRSAVLNLIDDQHQFQLAAHGCEPMVTDRADSMCEITLRLGDQLVVPDTSQDERFATNPWVTGELGRVRFYAASPLRAPGGHLVGTICVFDTEPRTLDEGQRAALRTLSVGVIDVLELRRRSDQLRQTVAELARSHRQLASFASQLSHNLKTPLTASLGFGELLQDHPTVRQDPTALDYVNRSVSASQRMMSAIDQLLSYASMGGAPQREPTPVHELVEQVLADLGPAAADAEVRCDRATVTADPVQLRVLLHNLIENAVTYRNPDARCEVAVTVAPTRWGSELRVADNGPGIPAEQRPAVLRPLVRLESETAAGSGLGLATCERIVAAHGGTLSITDTAGGGATVCVRLPGTGATQS